MKLLVLIFSLFLTSIVFSQEPPQLAPTHVFVPYSVILMAADKTPVELTNNNLSFIKIKNDSVTRLGVVHLGVDGKLVRFYFDTKIQLDSYRLPFWLEEIKATASVTKQPYYARITKIETGDKFERDEQGQQTCSRTVMQNICRMIQLPDGRWVQQCRPEYRTFWGHQYYAKRIIEGQDLYQFVITEIKTNMYDILLSNLDVAYVDFNIPKKQEFLTYLGECIIPYYPGPWNQ